MAGMQELLQQHRITIIDLTDLVSWIDEYEADV